MRLSVVLQKLKQNIYWENSVRLSNDMLKTRFSSRHIKLSNNKIQSTYNCAYNVIISNHRRGLIFIYEGFILHMMIDYHT